MPHAHQRRNTKVAGIEGVPLHTQDDAGGLIKQRLERKHDSCAQTNHDNQATYL